MKQFNITAQVHDMCGKNPNQSILYNEVIIAENIAKARNKFEFDLLVDDIIVKKIFSIEEIIKANA